MTAASNGVVCHHEWGTLKEAIVGISPSQDFVIPNWYPGLDFMPPKFKELSQNHGGKHLIEVDPIFAIDIETEVDEFAKLLISEGIVVHRPTRLVPPESTYLTAEAEGAQLYPRDDILVVGEQVIELGLKIQWRRREIFGVRPVIQSVVQNAIPGTDTNWQSMPLASPPAEIGGEDANPNNCFLAGGDILLNGYEIYVGNSGLASNTNGINWLQRQLGPRYSVHEIPVVRRSLHLDTSMMLVGPKLGLICRDWMLPGELPESLQDFDWVEVSEAEAELLGCNVCVLDENKIAMSAQQTKVGKELAAKLNDNLDVLWVNYSNVVQLGGGLRCSHHPLIRQSTLSS